MALPTYKQMLNDVSPDVYPLLDAGERNRKIARGSWITINSAANRQVKEWYLRNSDDYRQLWELKTLTWTASGTRGGPMIAGQFEQSVSHTDSIGIVEEMDSKVKGGILPRYNPASYTVFDVCMDNCGFIRAIRNILPRCEISGITLPANKLHLASNGSIPFYSNHGNFESILQVAPGAQQLPPFPGEPVCVDFLDITLLKAEFNVQDISKRHPQYMNFSTQRPYFGEKFDLVFADGHVLAQNVTDDSHCLRMLRLFAAQIVLGLTRIKQGGTLIIRLDFHEHVCYELFHLIHCMRKLASIHFFKPSHVLRDKSCGYLIAKDFFARDDQPLWKMHESFNYILERWQSIWEFATIYGYGNRQREEQLRRKLEDVSPESLKKQLETKDGKFLMSMLRVPITMQIKALAVGASGGIN